MAWLERLEQEHAQHPACALEQDGSERAGAPAGPAPRRRAYPLLVHAGAPHRGPGPTGGPPGPLWRAAGSAAQPAVRARALDSAGRLAYRQGDHASSRALLEEGVELSRRLEDSGALAWSLGALSRVYCSAWATPPTRTMCVECVVLARRAGDPTPWPGLWRSLGAAVGRTDPALARTLLAESLAHCRRSGDAWFTAVTPNALAKVGSTPATTAAALPLYRHSLDPCAGPQATVSAPRAGCTTWVTRPPGRRPAPGSVLLGRAWRCLRRRRRRHGLAWALWGLAEATAALGRTRKRGAPAGDRLAPPPRRHHLLSPSRTGRPRAYPGRPARRLGETAFIAAWAAGQAQALEPACDGAWQVAASLPGRAGAAQATPHSPRARGGGAGGRGALNREIAPVW